MGATAPDYSRMTTIGTPQTPESLPSPASGEGPSAPGLPRRILLVVVAPGAVFARLRHEPATLAALALGASIVALSNLLIPVEIWEAGVRDQFLEAGQDLPDDLALVTQIGRIAAVLGAFVAWPLFALAAAGVYLLLFVGGMRYEGRYRQYLSVVAHALLIPAIGALLLVPLRIHTEDAQFSLTLGGMVPGMEEGFLRAFLDLLNLFNLWAFVLIGIGAAAVDGRKGAGAAIGAAVGLALLLSAVLAAFMQ